MKKVVIVEDNYDFREFIKRGLSGISIDLEIIEFSSSKEAIGHISQNDFDVLFLDGELSWGDHGSSVLEMLSSEQIKKTILTSASDDFINEAKSKGVSIFIDKDFPGIRISKIYEYLLEKVNMVLI